MMDNEFDQSKESRIQRKRTSLIASLVASLQKDEHIEAKKNEQEKTDLSRNEILHEMFLFLVAGFETGATSLAWFIHLVRINPVVYFSLKTSTIYPPSANITVDQIDNGPIEQDIITHNIKTRSYNPKVALRCNRGMNARLWLGGKKYNYRCFCPPSYYGKLCQYQNQRVSLTLRLLPIDRYSIYEIVVKLIDDNYEINSYQKFVFLSSWGCSMKFNTYLLYSTRPKDISKNYSLHIDVFDKTNMKYYASWYLTIPFLFLPINRLVAQLNIPYRQVEIDHSCNLKCRNNDRCMKYVNTEIFFCQCHDNWSGTLCDIPTNCADYSTDSICIGSMNNQSICVCPNNKFGPRCLLTSCLSNTCQNNGRLTKKKFSCICPNEFYGTKYEYRKIRLDISFEKMANPSHILIYIGIISNDSYPKHMVMFQKLKHKQHSVTFHILEAFHIVFAKINHNYFLIVLQQYPRHFISTLISSNRQCAPINELFTSTVMTMAYIQ
ncbi:unnamed protein product [Rotaria sordida]|uniref:EGF-like domain-containing protein n=1 Tax=Rotaria sordida TaxID=392033 RepID=A0A814ITW2_9BILA|nr:unnamed protein product [Rotaria sordida]CAF1151993.1 unnamed protein product [Rotaria sordida]